MKYIEVYIPDTNCDIANYILTIPKMSRAFMFTTMLEAILNKQEVNWTKRVKKKPGIQPKRMKSNVLLEPDLFPLVVQYVDFLRSLPGPVRFSPALRQLANGIVIAGWETFQCGDTDISVKVVEGKFISADQFLLSFGPKPE